MMSSISPFISILVAAIAIIFYITSTATDHWQIESPASPNLIFYYGLWRYCTVTPGSTDCESLSDNIQPRTHIDYGCIRGVRGLMLTAIIVACITWILAVLALVEKSIKSPHLAFFKGITKPVWRINGIVFCVSGLLVLVGTTWFAVGSNFFPFSNMKYWFGYSIILGWISVPLGIIAGILLAVVFPSISEDAYSSL